MGFFHNDVAPRRAKAGQGRPKGRVQITAELQRHLSCTQCPLNNAALTTPKMAPSGTESPEFYFLGGVPSMREDVNGQPFTGDSGAYLLDIIPEGYLQYIRWNHTIRCHSGDAVQGGIETSCCRRYQVEDIEKTKPWAIVGFGPAALDWVLSSGKQISNWRGRRWPVKIGSHTCWFYCVESPAHVMQMSGNRDTGEAYVDVFKRDVEKVFTDYENNQDEAFVEAPDDYKKNIHCVQVYGQEGLDLIANGLGAFRNIDHALDLETNDLRPYRKDYKILSLSAGVYDDVISFGWMHPEARWSPQELKHLHDIVEWYLIGAGRKWCQKASMEQEWLLREFGADVLYKTKWGCTLLQAHVLDERSDKALEDLTLLHFGFDLKALTRLDKSNMEGESLLDILPYNGMDTKYTDALWHVQQERLEHDNLVATYELLNTFYPNLVQMQAKNVVRNMPEIIAQDKKFTKEEERILFKIMQHPDVVEFRNQGGTFSPTSNPNLVIFFKDFLRLPNPNRGDGYSLDESVLSKFGHPVGDLILELRGIQKVHGYITPLKDGGKYVHQDGYIHANYSPTVTRSGRLACSDPNETNYPRREYKEVRRIVGCPPGHLMVACDQGQIEWRIGAEESGDKTMIAQIKAKEDIHGEWTDKIGKQFAKKELSESRKKVRDALKGLWTFANLYGNTLNGLAWGLSEHFKIDITPQKLEPFYIQFWDLYPDLQIYQHNILKKYRELGYVETSTGFRRRGVAKPNEIINHPLQGTACHVVTEQGVRLSHDAWRMQRPSLQSIFNIHDDLTFYIPKGRQMEDDIEHIGRAMVVSPFVKRVPLAVEVSVGSNWADKEEIHTFYTTDF